MLGYIMNTQELSQTRSKEQSILDTPNYFIAFFIQCNESVC